MSDFVPGFAARHALTAVALQQAFALPAGFAVREAAPVPAAEPRHFSPADPSANPTAGWDPLDPTPPAAPAAARLDPVAEARAAGFAEGQAAALAALAEAQAREASFADRLATALIDARAIDREKLATQLRMTVLALVRRIVGEAGIAGDLLAARVDAAVALLADKNESALLRLNPEDLAATEGALPATVFAAGDVNLARGSFVLETASAIVEDGPELWLDQLAAAFDRAPLPRAA